MLEMELCELIYEIYRDNFEMIFIRFLFYKAFGKAQEADKIQEQEKRLL